MRPACLTEPAGGDWTAAAERVGAAVAWLSARDAWRWGPTISVSPITREVLVEFGSSRALHALLPGVTAERHVSRGDRTWWSVRHDEIEFRVDERTLRGTPRGTRRVTLGAPEASPDGPAPPADG